MKFIYMIVRLYIGFLIAAIATVMLINSNLGLSPWNVLNHGISKISIFTIGQANILIGILVIIFSVILGVNIGISTLLNVFSMGLFMDIILESKMIPIYENLYMQIMMLFAGMFLLAYGMYIYLSCGLGCAPRDGLMVALAKRTSFSIGLIRCGIELCAIFLGYLLGGYVGLGTLITGIFSGYIINFVFRLLKFNVKQLKQLSLREGLEFYGYYNYSGKFNKKEN